MRRISPLLFSVLLACAPTVDAPAAAGSSTAADPSTSAVDPTSSTSGSSTGSTSGASTHAAETLDKAPPVDLPSDDASNTSTSTGSASTGEPAPICWASECSAAMPCDPGLVCEVHPDAVDLWICTAPCIQAGPAPSCITEPFACGQVAPLGECQPGADESGRCFPVLCEGGLDCKAGAQCIDGYCFE